MKRVLMCLLSVFLVGCGSFFTIGEGEFSCPHVRSHLRCMPPSEVEKLDEAGKLDWRWHPYPGEAVKPDVCTPANAEAYLKLCSPSGSLKGTKICRDFAEKCIHKKRTVFMKGTMAPSGASPVVKIWTREDRGEDY